MTFTESPYRAGVLLLVWLLAMGIGFLFKRYVQGAKGWEQVPLIDWYKDFGNLQAVSSYGAFYGRHCNVCLFTGRM